MKRIVNVLRAFALLSIFVSLPNARAETRGFNFGYFYPSSSSVRDLYGNGWLNIGVSIPLNTYEAFREERFEYISIDYIHNSHSGVYEGLPYNAYITNIPLIYNTRYRTSGKNFYYVYGIGFNYLKVKVEMEGASDSDSELDIGGQLAFGYGTKNFALELRYIEFGRTGNTGIALNLIGRF
ncbi:hypothetical protein H5T88_02720 [bacterium]|nr:hypothetical protein [bacterium]